MNRLILTICFFTGFSLVNINADNVKFGWNIGNIGFSYEALNNSFDVGCEIGHFNWLIANKYSIGFNVLGMSVHDINETENVRYSILPVEVAFVPINYKNWVFASIYGKAGFEIMEGVNENNTKKNIFGAAGVNFFIFPEMKFHYSPYMSLFIEYNTHNELKMGMKMDISAILYFGLLSFKEDKEREYNRKFY